VTELAAAGTRYARVEQCWNGGDFVEEALVSFDANGIRPVDGPGDAVLGRLPGTLLPPLTDAHVHLGLTDFAERAHTALARVLDLGWAPEALAELVAAGPATTEIRFAGAFLAAPGGYPSDRSWAPDDSVCPVAGPDAAEPAVRRQHAAGASVIKVTLHAGAGPVLTEPALRAIVRSAHRLGLPVIAHVEGAGTAEYGWRCGVDAFAHTPFSERLGDEQVTAMAERMRWISTLDMHGRGEPDEHGAVALDNLRRFAAAGGVVLYGTDLGNGATAAELNPRELAGLRAAGVDGHRLLGAVTGAGLLPRWARTATLLPEPVTEPAAAIEALSVARPVAGTNLVEQLS
jgi:hypothetical protein